MAKKDFTPPDTKLTVTGRHISPADKVIKDAQAATDKKRMSAPASDDNAAHTFLSNFSKGFRGDTKK
jgi:hypothetical protein